MFLSFPSVKAEREASLKQGGAIHERRTLDVSGPYPFAAMTQLQTFRLIQALPNFAHSFSLLSGELGIAQRSFAGVGALYC